MEIFHYTQFKIAAIINNGPIPQGPADQNTIDTALNITFTLIGAITLLFFVIAGLRYTLSKGEPDNVQRAKNEMKYAVIGLIIVALAYPIVKFVVSKI